MVFHHAGGAIKGLMNAVRVQKKESVRQSQSTPRHSKEVEESARPATSNSGKDPMASIKPINIRRSISHLERWPDKVDGYVAIACYSVFFMLFTQLVIWQLDVPNAYQIDNLVRNDFLDYTGALANVATHGDFFDYLLKSFDSDSGSFEEGSEPNGGILGTMMPNAFYNDQPIPEADKGFLFSYNKLIGGVLITQHRGKRKSCGEETGNSTYTSFYPECYSNEEFRADPPEEIMIKPKTECGEKQIEMSLDTNHTLYQEYVKMVEGSKFGIAKEPVGSIPPAYVGTILDSFKYKYENEENKGYSVFLSLSDGSTLNLQKIEYLKAAQWLDKDTRSIDIRFTFYNGNFGTFTFAKVKLTFQTVGRYGPFDPEAASVQQLRAGGNKISIGTINMEPYITENDFWRLGFEIIFMVWVFYDICSLLIIGFKIATDTDGYQKGDARFSWWYLLDLSNYACYVQYIYYRISALNLAICTPVFVPANSYLTIFEEIYKIQQSQLEVNYISILLGIFRFFKYYEFQPRLQIVNMTLMNSAIHLFHFSIVFLVMLFGFALIGHLNFGSQIRDFSTIGNSIQVMWESLFGTFDLGPVIGNYGLSYVDPLVSVFFFYVWMFIAVMILLNIFVAILMDGYAAAKEDGVNQAEIDGLEAPDAVYDDIVVALKKMWRKTDKRAWLYKESLLVPVLSAIDEDISNPVLTSHAYRKRYEEELQELKKDKDAIETRIKFLEEMTIDDLDEKPFHIAWHDKSLSYTQLATRLKQLPAFKKHDVTPSEVYEMYASSLRSVEQLSHQDQEEHVYAGEREDDTKIALHSRLQEQLKNLMVDNAKLKREKDAIMNLFQHVDADNDGKLSKEEIKAAMQNTADLKSLKARNPEVQRIWDSLDRNKDGQVDEEEFKAALLAQTVDMHKVDGRTVRSALTTDLPKTAPEVVEGHTSEDARLMTQASYAVA